MVQTEASFFEGTPRRLAAILGRLSDRNRFRLVEIEYLPVGTDTQALVDPDADATIALLESWIPHAPTDPVAIREAEEDLLEFKRTMNAPRMAAGARPHFPDVELP